MKVLFWFMLICSLPLAAKPIRFPVYIDTHFSNQNSDLIRLYWIPEDRRTHFYLIISLESGRQIKRKLNGPQFILNIKMIENANAGTQLQILGVEGGGKKYLSRKIALSEIRQKILTKIDHREAVLAPSKSPPEEKQAYQFFVLPYLKYFNFDVEDKINAGESLSLLSGAVPGIEILFSFLGKDKWRGFTGVSLEKSSFFELPDKSLVGNDSSLYTAMFVGGSWNLTAKLQSAVKLGRKDQLFVTSGGSSAIRVEALKVIYLDGSLTWNFFEKGKWQMSGVPGFEIVGNGKKGSFESETSFLPYGELNTKYLWNSNLGIGGGMRFMHGNVESNDFQKTYQMLQFYTNFSYAF